MSFALLQDDPDVEEVEVNLDGQWRPEGRGGRWRTIDEDPAAARAAAASADQARPWLSPVPYCSLDTESCLFKGQR